jgi:hypothetical protein
MINEMQAYLIHTLFSWFARSVNTSIRRLHELKSEFL